jgi:hypothetical protein
MPYLCPRCCPLGVRGRNRSGLNCCEKCGSLFLVPPGRSLPLWILGVLVILAANYLLAIR